jgi:hypothetical protein
VGALSLPAAASAHLRSGTVAVDYRVSVAEAHTRAYDARIYQSDHGLSLTIKRGHQVAMLGYLGEPVFRLDRTGLWINAASPTALGIGLLARGDAVSAPSPRWRVDRGRTTATWHDARVQTLPPGVQSGRWRVPLTVDGRALALEGRLWRFPAPDVWIWSGVLAALVLSVAVPLRLRRREVTRRAAVGFCGVAAAASVILTCGFALDEYASPGTWILGLNATALLVFGLWGALRGPKSLRLAGVIGVGLLAAAVGLINGAVFLHPIVLAALPAPVIRALVLAAVGFGTNAAVLACVLYVEPSAASEPPGAIGLVAAAAPRAGLPR